MGQRSRCSAQEVRELEVAAKQQSVGPANPVASAAAEAEARMLAAALQKREA